MKPLHYTAITLALLLTGPVMAADLSGSADIKLDTGNISIQFGDDEKESRRHSRVETTTRTRSADIPPGHMPPPGQCRIWYHGKPPGQQPAPGNCQSLRRQVPAGASLIHG